MREVLTYERKNLKFAKLDQVMGALEIVCKDTYEKIHAVEAGLWG